MNEILKLRDLVYQKTGMYFPEEKRYYFETRFLRRMQVLDIPSYTDYYQYLTGQNGDRDEFNLLMNELTINETSFFRNRPQFTALKDLVLPEIARVKQEKGQKTLKIWSAGCSSGEELYTIAMLVDEVSETFFKDWRIEIVGTDISKRVLQMAKRGQYKEYVIRNMPEEYRNRYIVPVKDGYEIKEELRRHVRLSHMNLCDDMAMIFLKGYDIIMCRNVLIYFDLDSKKRVIQHIFNSLAVGGYLFIGYSESLYGINDRFKLIQYPGGMVYQKVAHI